MTTAAAFLFDCDGLLLDSESLWLESVVELADSLGAPVRRETYTGITSKAASKRLATVLESDWRYVEAELSRIYEEKLHAGVSVMPGVREFLCAQPAGLPLAVVSNGLRTDIERMLADTGLSEYFELLVCADEVARPKPDPSPYTLAAQRLGVDIDRCIVFEDSAVGCEAGLRAGATVIAVQAAEVQLPSHHRVSSFHELLAAPRTPAFSAVPCSRSWGAERSTR